jgi:hypothetical protein
MLDALITTLNDREHLANGTAIRQQPHPRASGVLRRVVLRVRDVEMVTRARREGADRSGTSAGCRAWKVVSWLSRRQPGCVTAELL